MMELALSPRTTTFGCGIYEAGDTDRCYVRLFVTDSGCVLPVNHRIISDEDLMTVYKWGYEDGVRSLNVAAVESALGIHEELPD